MTQQNTEESDDRNTAWRLRWLNIRRASLKQIANALEMQRRAVLSELGEIEKELDDDLRSASAE